MTKQDMTMVLRNPGTMVPQGGNKMGKMAKNAFQQGVQAGVAYLMSNPKGALKKGKDAWNYMTAGGVPSGIVHSGGMKGAIMAPVAVTRQLRGSKPKFSGRTSGSVTVSHRELITQVNNLTCLRLPVTPPFTTNCVELFTCVISSL